MDIDLSPQDAAFRDEVRAFLAASLPDSVREGAAATPSVFVEPEIGQTWNAVLNEKGWLGYQWPAAYGGTGWSPVQRYIFEKECALAGAPNLTVLSLKLVAPVIYSFGTEAQKAFYLPRILSGEDYWCQGFSEPGSGSDLASLGCRAVRDGDRYIIDGSKIWTTHAHHANRMFCLARTDASGRKQAGISFFLVDMNQPGVSVRPILTTAGDHEVNQVFLERVEVSADDLVGQEGDGWKIAKFLLENERGGTSFAPGLLADLARLRAATGPLAGELSDRFVRLQLEAEALEMTELRTLIEVESGAAPDPRSLITKLLASEIRQGVEELAVDAFGLAGLQLPLERPLYGPDTPMPCRSAEAQAAAARYLNARAWSIFGGTSEIQLTIIAKAALGL